MPNQSKKIFDVSPPEEKLVKHGRAITNSNRKFSFLLLFAAGIVFSLVFLGFFLIKPTAEITVFPKKESVNLQTEVLLSGEIFDSEETIAKEFLATGAKIKNIKAEGTIRVYNNYSSVSQPLVAATRFVSADGKLFRTPERVVVPGSGFIDIKVIADQPGSDYNIGPTTFSIPGFAGTPKYTSFYAKSSSSMTGGQISQVKTVTNEDLEKAKKVLQNSAKDAVKTSLENLIPKTEYILLEEAINQEMQDIVFSAKTGQELEKFTGQIEIKSKALAVKKIDLENFAKDFINSKIPQGKKLQNSSLEMLYYPKSIDFNKKKISLDVKLSANIYSIVDENSLKGVLQNKKANQIQNLLGAFPEIERVQVKLSPFWSRSAPKQSERIIIKMGVD